MKSIIHFFYDSKHMHARYTYRSLSINEKINLKAMILDKSGKNITFFIGTKFINKPIRLCYP